MSNVFKDNPDKIDISLEGLSKEDILLRSKGKISDLVQTELVRHEAVIECSTALYESTLRVENDLHMHHLAELEIVLAQINIHINQS